MFSPVCFQLDLDTKFCPHVAGGIHVAESFTISGGRVDISGSSAKHGGAVLRSSSGVFGRILRWL